jgi:hypothetical protein
MHILYHEKKFKGVWVMQILPRNVDFTPVQIFENSFPLRKVSKLLYEKRDKVRMTASSNDTIITYCYKFSDQTGVEVIFDYSSDTQKVLIKDREHVITYLYWKGSIAEVLCNNAQIYCYEQMEVKFVQQYNKNFRGIINVLLLICGSRKKLLQTREPEIIPDSIFYTL